MFTAPQVALRPCSECKKWLFRDDGTIVVRLGKQVNRPAGAPTPCWKCPKKSPDQAWEYELSNANVKTYIVYQAVTGTRGACLAGLESRDEVLIRNLGIVHELVESHKQLTLARVLSGKGM